MTDDLSRPRETPLPAIILVEPQLGENIGMVARAMANFGLSELRLVKPRDGWPNESARATASRADHVIDAVAVFGTLQEAVADLAYVGSPFIATDEANAVPAYKQAIVEGTAEDIVYSNLFTGVHGNYLRQSIVNAGLDPDNLPESDPSAMNFGGAKAWKDIWGSGQGIGAVHAVEPAAAKIERMKAEYAAAKAALAAL